MVIVRVKHSANEMSAEREDKSIQLKALYECLCTFSTLVINAEGL